MNTNCVLCFNTNIKLFYKIKNREYCVCKNCKAVFLPAQYHLSCDKEKQRYLEHNNNVEDLKYQQSALPLIHRVKQNFSKNHLGLDFGAGTRPVVAKLLTDDCYSIKLYDPYFHNDFDALKTKYDYIICCEVIEHFSNPEKEFKLLKSILKKGGMIFCKTSLYNDNIDFKNWYYKNDLTHIFFYTVETLDWIKIHFNFLKLKINNNLIEYSN